MLLSDFYNKNCPITANYSTLSTVTTKNNLFSISALNLLKEYNATISNKNQDVLSALLQSQSCRACIRRHACYISISLTETSAVSSIQLPPLAFSCVTNTKIKHQIVARTGDDNVIFMNVRTAMQHVT